MATKTSNSNSTRSSSRAKKPGASKAIGKKLVVVESPTKERTIQQFLGDEYLVMATKGHIRDLPEGRLGVDVRTMTPTYVVYKDSQDIVRKLKRSGKTAPAIYLATDPDREGEAIAWHAMAAAEFPENVVQRVVFHAITPDAVREAFANPRGIDSDLVNAQQARRVLDRIVGFPLSKDVSTAIGKRGLSAGRVQSSALRLIADRDQEIDLFVPREYWNLIAVLTSSDGTNFKVKLHNLIGVKDEIELPHEASATNIADDIRDSSFSVKLVSTKDVPRKPGAPFITSTLQQDAARKLNYSTTKTMSVAQSLFEGVDLGGQGRIGLITYMRTDSPQIAKEGVAEIREYIGDMFGQLYLSKSARNYSSKSKVAQEAHEAIRPTSIKRTPESIKTYLKPDELRLYRLIWERAVASQMADSVIDQTTVVVETKGISGSIYEFRSSGSRLKFAGWRQVYAEIQNDEQESEKEESNSMLPQIAKDQILPLTDLHLDQHFTRPAPRYNEASLVKDLEARGVGRPSTYASIINTLVTRKYVKRERRVLISTPLGGEVSDHLKSHWPGVVDIDFTDQMEQRLDAVANGKEEWQDTTSDIYTDIGFRIPKETVETNFDCPRCGKKFRLIDGPNGLFFSCSGYPRCRNTAELDQEINGPKSPVVHGSCPHCEAGNLQQRDGKNGTYFLCDNHKGCRYTTDLLDPDDLGSGPRPPEFCGTCPKCQSAQLVTRTGRLGPYVLCMGSKKSCGYIGSVASEEPEETHGICPKCEQYPLVKRNGRRGPFFGCSGYRDIKCVFTADVGSDGKPQQRLTYGACPDPKCDGGELVIRVSRRGPFYGCTRYPKCRFASPRKRVSEQCPDCHGDLVTGPARADGTTQTLCSQCSWSRNSSEMSMTPGNN